MLNSTLNFEIGLRILVSAGMRIGFRILAVFDLIHSSLIWSTKLACEIWESCMGLMGIEIRYITRIVIRRVTEPKPNPSLVRACSNDIGRRSSYGFFTITRISARQET